MARTAAPAAGQLTASDVLGRVILVTGKEEYLGERTVQAARRAVREHDAEAEFSEALAADLTLATLGELSAPSLFSSIRCVVVRALENLPDESVAGLVEYAGMPSEEVALVLVHGGGPKGSGTVNKLKKLPKVSEHKSAELKARELTGFVKTEVRSHGASIDDEGAELLIQAVGQDLRSLAGAASQLAGDFPKAKLGGDQVSRYFGGRAEVKNYVIADAIIGGDRVKAFEEIRWALETGSAPVYILSAVAGQLRSVASHVAGIRDSSLPPWKQKSLSSLARGWSREGVGQALRAVARADADLKGAASDPAYTLERLVLTLAALRTR
ncbi:MAG: DNA polymerase III subunit delta [Nocardioides sp.]|nr:DNA polymerase III subunit delta [Nocardioides sp.]